MFGKQPPPPATPLRFLYVHVYKCGGSSMRKHITDHLVTPDTNFVDQWAYAWERDITPPDRLLGNVTRSEMLRLGPLAGTTGRTVVATHSFFYEWMKGLPEFRFGTMLRDPIARIVSQFGFQRREFGMHEDQSVVDFINGLPSFELNLQTAAFCGSPRLDIDATDLEQAKANLHYFEFLGFVEDYEGSLRLFNRLFGIESSAPAPQVNVSPHPPLELPAPVLEALRDRGRFDLELYDYADRLYRAKLAALELLDSGDPDTPPPSIPTA